MAWLRVETHEGRPVGPFQQRRLLAALEPAALQALDRRPGMWHVAGFSDDLIVVFTDPVAGAHLYSLVRQETQALLATLTERGDALVTVGMGTPQAGPDGIRQSAAEARAPTSTTPTSGSPCTPAPPEISTCWRPPAGRQPASTWTEPRSDLKKAYGSAPCPSESR